MKWFWFVYGCVVACMFWKDNWAIAWEVFYYELVRPVVIRGGVALAGLHGIWAVISAYLSN